MRRTDAAYTTLPAALAASVGFVLSKAAQGAVALTEAALRPFSLKPQHYGVLVLVSQHRGQSQQVIAHQLQIDQTTMATMVDDLERLGLVVRRVHPANRRARALKLTALGAPALLTAAATFRVRRHQRKRIGSSTPNQGDLPAWYSSSFAIPAVDCIDRAREVVSRCRPQRPPHPVVYLMSQHAQPEAQHG
jgi:DNA-binding MarR family transcriptional regulator